MSIIFIEGIFFTYISPPNISSSAFHTNLTPSSNEIMNLVILKSVIGKNPSLSFSKKKGITDPREPITFPYLTTENLHFAEPEYEFPATNNLSDANLVAPYKLIGFDALSVDKATHFFIPLSKQASIKFIAPRTLVFTHSNGLYSAVGTILVAAACTT